LQFCKQIPRPSKRKSDNTNFLHTIPTTGHKATTPKQSLVTLKDMPKKKYLNWVTKQAKLFIWTLVHITNNFAVTFHVKLDWQTCVSENINHDPRATRLITFNHFNVQYEASKWGEVVAIFKNAFVVHINGTSSLPLQIWLTAMTSIVIEPFQQLIYRLAKLLQARHSGMYL
jgi:hypothetical protein